MLRPTHPKLLGPAKWTYFYLHAEGAIMPSEGCFGPSLG